MTYKIEGIEGIGTQFGQQLMSVGVNTAADLLEKCSTPEKLRQVELASGISAKQLSTWMRQADLMRVSGIGTEFGQLLERSGVESVKELATRTPENITQLLARVNEEKHLTRAVPALKTVEGWIDRAKVMAAADAATPAASKPLGTPAPAATDKTSHVATPPSDKTSHMATPPAKSVPTESLEPAVSQTYRTAPDTSRAPMSGNREKIEATERVPAMSH